MILEEDPGFYFENYQWFYNSKDPSDRYYGYYSMCGLNKNDLNSIY